MYAKGFTVGLNQCERKKNNTRNPFATVDKVKKYKPKNISELSAFIAAIRPGFKSMYSRFEKREDFNWGIPALDNLIRTKELPVSFLFFQEQVMSVLNYAGFPMDECYGIIKSIAKKHPEKVKPLKSRFIEGFRNRLIQEEHLPYELAQTSSEKVWQIINDNCGYGFNSAHAFSVALDSLYNAWQKANHPYEFYEVLLNHYTEKGNKEKVSWLKEEMLNAFGIKEGKFKFGIDNRRFVADKEHQCIIPSLVSIKGIGQECANYLYKVYNQNNYESCYDIFSNIKISNSLYEILIKLGYFDDYGSRGKILEYKKVFDTLYERKQFDKSSIKDSLEPFMPLIKKYSDVTEKQYKNFDYKAALNECWNNIKDKDLSISQLLLNEDEYLGYCKSVYPNIPTNYAFVRSVVGKQKRTVTLYRLSDGTSEIVKVKQKLFNNNPINPGDIIKTIDCVSDKKWKRNNETGEFYQIDEQELLLLKWSKVEND